jgi:ubiquinone biosynthesis protein
MLQLAGTSGFRLPGELAMLGKWLLNLDNVGRTLDPGFDPNAAIRRYAGKLLRQRLLKRLSTANFHKMTMNLEELVENLPQSIGKTIGTFGDNDFKIGIDAIDEKYLLGGFKRSQIASRWGLYLRRP